MKAILLAIYLLLARPQRGIDTLPLEPLPPPGGWLSALLRGIVDA